MSHNKQKTAFIFIAVFFVAIDRFLKILALKMPEGKSIKLIGEFFHFNFAPNYNIAFSLPLGGLFLNVLVGIIILILVIFLIFFYKRERLYEFAGLTFLLFGAISNYTDRLRFGFVVDYLDLKYFTVFNVADCLIVGAVFWFFLLNLFENKKNKSACQ